jgi:hypothetical protein
MFSLGPAVGQSSNIMYLDKETYTYGLYTLFVLMLENRLFDHVFGFSPINGTDAVTGRPTTIGGQDPGVNISMDMILVS